MLSSPTMPHPYEARLIAPVFVQRLQRLARKHTHWNTIGWEDAAQAAQIKILQAMRDGKFRQGGAADFDRWALTVARFEIIDLVRRERHRDCTSLDAVLLGTDLRLADTIADEFNSLDSLERTDLIQGAIAAITTLHQAAPERGYLALWQGQVQGKTQTQLAQALGLSQGEVSKRWKELVSQLAIALGLVPPIVKPEPKRRGRPPRSQANW
jgi:RNA polymerase sporulation-specific sigma factor